ncbi:MAG: hypothetical protein ABW133_23155, partial [Polyangiaceae bacterium]
AVSLASAAGLFITGFFLYQLDRPASEEIHRPSQETPRRPVNVLSSVRVLPITAPSNVGGMVRVVF